MRVFGCRAPQIPLKPGQFSTLVGLIAPCTCDAHLRTRMASMRILSCLLDLHGTGKVGHQEQSLHRAGGLDAGWTGEGWGQR